MTAYAEFPVGVVRLGVACDDGFAVYAGASAATATEVIGIREPGGGTVPSAFDFVVEKAGVYALKLLFFDFNSNSQCVGEKRVSCDLPSAVHVPTM